MTGAPAPDEPAAPFDVVVTSVSAEARDVMRFTLERAGGGTLPACGPGGHIELALPGGLVRHYSLVNDCRDTDRYVIAVGLADDSRGGAEHMHRRVREGSRLRVTAVRNNFALDESAPGYLFVAGGIGITPIMPMIRWCRQQDRPWRLVYAARSRQRAAFYEDLARAAPDNVSFHFDDERGARLDAAEALARATGDAQIYCCGPAPMMAAVRDLTAHLPAGRVHFEWFNAPATSSGSDAGEQEAFTLHLDRSRRDLSVLAGQSVLETLEAAGVPHPFSCREGACGTCAARVLEGLVDHRDFVLSDDERARGDTMLVCVSRAAGPRLVLDL